MARNKGTFNFAANYEVLIKAPLDARLVVSNILDLLNPVTWRDAANLEWLYTGMPVSVVSDPNSANNGLWFLLDEATFTSSASWVKVGTNVVADASGTNYQSFQINQDEQGVVLKDVSGNLQICRFDGSLADVSAGIMEVTELKITNKNGVLYAIDGLVLAEEDAKPMLAYDASILGNGTARVFSVNHNLNSVKQQVNVWDLSTDTIINPGIKKGLNTNQFTFTTAPGIGENYNVNIMGFR